MGDFTAIFVVGFVMLAVYKVFELFVRRRERMLLIEKLASLSEANENEGNRLKIQLPLIFESDSSFWPLRISLLLIGIGIGCLSAFFIRINSNNNLSWDLESLVNFASIATFGGIGLLIAYFIEQNKKAKK
jgi:H+/Cl- antiporter ClcA